MSMWRSGLVGRSILVGLAGTGMLGAQGAIIAAVFHNLSTLDWFGQRRASAAFRRAIRPAPALFAA